MSNKKMKAIALISGGLDSTLAAKVVLEQGVEVVAVSFINPFCKGVESARKAAEGLGVEFKTISAADEFIELVKKPKHGYGKNINPCIDCRIFVIKKAGKLMEEIGASFLITGEVMGQRPMSQHKPALDIVERESGLQGLILRPLSAKLLEITIPEERGWIDREKLLGLSGRSRKPQIQLAKDYGISGYLTPAGGCLLTDERFSRKLRDVMNNEKLTSNYVDILKVGRHFRLSPKAKLIVGRDKKENEKLTNLAEQGDIVFEPVVAKGPIALGRGVFNESDIVKAGAIAARYCDRDSKQDILMKVLNCQDEDIKEISVSPLEESEIQGLRV